MKNQSRVQRFYPFGHLVGLFPILACVCKGYASKAGSSIAGLQAIVFRELCYKIFSLIFFVSPGVMRIGNIWHLCSPY